MKTNKYELDLLIEAIAIALTKDKRPRGDCDRFEMIAPIRDNTPDYFKAAIDISDTIRKGDFGSKKL